MHEQGRWERDSRGPPNLDLGRKCVVWLRSGCKNYRSTWGGQVQGSQIEKRASSLKPFCSLHMFTWVGATWHVLGFLRRIKVKNVEITFANTTWKIEKPCRNSGCLITMDNSMFISNSQFESVLVGLQSWNSLGMSTCAIFLAPQNTT